LPTLADLQGESVPRIQDQRHILNTRVDATSYGDACDLIQHWVNTQTSCYIVPANVHVVMTAYWSRAYRTILDQAALVTPDGMPLVWGLRLLGLKQQPRVYGPDLMLAWCDRAARLGLPIYLYGGTDCSLGQLVANLQHRYPDLPIAGYHAPPFRPLTPAEEAADIEQIQQSGATVVFIGLGCPKQEQWMHRQRGKFPGVMIGVGAAFSFFSGEVQQAPRWIMKFGLEWLYRFSQEPARLWQRYLINNPAFILLFGLQLLGHGLHHHPVSSSMNKRAG
jgi:N-acetylglucosaminyldiphosphoundecaprenol N-acetyl-beta-D-mannosaminyltransferase